MRDVPPAMSDENTIATCYGCHQTVTAPADDIEAAMQKHQEQRDAWEWLRGLAS